MPFYADLTCFTLSGRIVESKDVLGAPTISPILHLMFVDFVFGIGYEDDIDKARQVIEGIIAEDNRVLKDPAPMVAVSELADSSVNFVARAWTAADDYWGFYFDTTEKVKKQFDAEGISIPYPQRDIHMYEHKEQPS